MSADNAQLPSYVKPTTQVSVNGGETYDIRTPKYGGSSKVRVPSGAFFAFAFAGHLIGLNLLDASNQIGITSDALDDAKKQVMSGTELKSMHEAVLAYLAGLSNDRGSDQKTPPGNQPMATLFGLVLASLHLQGKIILSPSGFIEIGPKGDKELMNEIQGVLAVLSGTYRGDDKVKATAFFNNYRSLVMGDLDPNIVANTLNNVSEKNKGVLEGFERWLQQGGSFMN
ncbi:MAG TPA: hypothetical protein VGE55_13220 [Limnobacter sp.]|uniref:hypothetical protein n=1 Tax=Limnobacter sp. TaxID=2003368 RepID=UPI002ED8B8CA